MDWAGIEPRLCNPRGLCCKRYAQLGNVPLITMQVNVMIRCLCDYFR